MDIREIAREVLVESKGSDFASIVDDIPDDGFLDILSSKVDNVIISKIVKRYEKSNVYEPREDSFLLQKCIKDFAKGKVLDMGTGSGILAKEASKYADDVEAVDINPFAVKAKSEGIKFYESDLFQKVKGKFDLIIFNPPYLPKDKEVTTELAHALYGGKHGYETAIRFIDEVNEYLNSHGNVLLLFTTIANIIELKKAFTRNMLDYEEIANEKHFYEEMIVFLTKKNIMRKELESKGFSHIQYFSQGKRGCIYTAELDGKKVAIKVKRESSEAINRIENEAYWLKRLNSHGIGPEIILRGEGYVAYEFAEGIFIEDLVRCSDRDFILAVFRDILKQCKIMDDIGVNKEEMHRPIKNIIIGDRPILIDFERCRITHRPKNVTQFCQFCGSNIKSLLESKGIHLDTNLLDLANTYKKNPSIRSYENILSVFK